MLPTGKECVQELILCEGDSIKGNDLSNMSKLAGDLNKFINDADKQEIIQKMVSSIEQFDSTQENLDELIYLSKKEIIRIEPLIEDLTIAANHLNNILSTIDDKETLEDIKLTLNAARSITSKIDDMSDDFEKLTQDKELTKSIRDLTIGLSKFLNEIYP